MIQSAHQRISIVKILVCLALLGGSYSAALWLKPTKYWADVIKGPNYDSIVPEQFGDWVHIPNQGARVVNPVQEAELMKLYSETVAKQYLHKPSGRMIMLSIAYGRNQSTDVQLHTPEQCYPSQGFRVESRQEHDIQTPYGQIKSVRLETTMGGQRPEPLTFFLRVGDNVVRGSKERNFTRLKMALQGYLIDGMLFRVSEITSDSASSFNLQDTFIRDLLKQVSDKDRYRLIGGSST